MQALFLKWVLQLDVIHTSSMPKLNLPKHEQYLNFNYTNSLEKIYSIPEKNIFYIHGKAKDAKSSIILGHGWDNYRKAMELRKPTFEEFVDGDYATEEDWQYKEAKQSIENYFEQNYKNATQIIQDNRIFFKNLKKIEEIFVMGHSMSEVDQKYFQAIAQNINLQQTKWVVSYYKKEDVENAKKLFQMLRIDIHLVQFKQLEDFFSNQLNLF